MTAVSREHLKPEQSSDNAFSCFAIRIIAYKDMSSFKGATLTDTHSEVPAGHRKYCPVACNNILQALTKALS